MQFSPIKLPPVHDPQNITRLQSYSHMKIIGGAYRLPKCWIIILFAMPLKMPCIQVTPPTKDKSHIMPALK